MGKGKSMVNIREDLIYKEEAYAIVGAAMAVYNELGPGFLESVYQEAFEIELAERGIPFTSQCELPVYYKGHLLKKFFIADVLIYDKIVVELKAIGRLTLADQAQLINELKASGMLLGLLVNFGAEKDLEWWRKVNTNPSKNKQVLPASERVHVGQQ
jgi:GxxExxY protein